MTTTPTDGHQETIPGATIEAAVWAFSRSRAQDEKAAKRIEALIMPVHASLPDGRRLSLATALATSSRISKKLAWLLANDHAEIARPFIKLSPVLDTSLLLELIMRRGLEHARLIARRTGLERDVVKALRDLNDAVIDRAIELRQKPVTQADAASNASLWADHVHAQNVLLRNLLLAGEEDKAVAMLAQRLGLTRASCGALLSAPRSANLANALFYLGFSAPDAWSLVTIVDTSLLHEPQAVGEFYRLFAGFDEASCRALVRQWVMDDLEGMCLVMKASNDNAGGQALPVTPESILLANWPSADDRKEAI